MALPAEQEDQDRQAKIEPAAPDASVCDQRVARISRRFRWCDSDARQPMQDGQNFAWVAGAAFLALAGIFVHHQTITVVVRRAIQADPAGLAKANCEPGHLPAQFAQHVGLDVLEAAIVGRKVQGDGQALVHARKRRLVGRRKTVAAILGDIAIDAGLSCRRQQCSEHDGETDGPADLMRERSPTRQPDAGGDDQRRADAYRFQCMGQAEQAMFKLAQGRRERHLRQRLEPGRLNAADGEIEHPETEGEGQGNDGGGGHAIGDCRREEGDAGDGEAIERMAQNQVEQFGHMEVAAEQRPDDDSRKGGQRREAPCGADRKRLDDQQRCRADRELLGKFRCARLPVLADDADGDERKQEGHGQIKSA